MDILYHSYLHSHILMFKARSFLTIFTCLLLIPGMKSFIILAETFIPIGSQNTEQLECKKLYNLKKIASTIQNSDLSEWEFVKTKSDYILVSPEYALIRKGNYIVL